MICFYTELQIINRLDKIDAANGENTQEHSRYLQELYLHNRNALLNICSSILIIQLYLTAHRYEKYKVIKEKAEEIKKIENEAKANWQKIKI